MIMFAIDYKTFIKFINNLKFNMIKNQLGHQKNISLISPQPYPEFVRLMADAYAIITDSGGIQEEAPSLNTPVIVVRNTTERAEGIESGLVAIAGDIRGFGPRTWKIGIRDPRPEDPEDGVMATVKLKDKAISTSGDYERSFTQDGVFYHHILNPKTGLPARGTWSVSVIADKAVLTDGFSTGVFVIGPDNGLKLIDELGMEGVIVAEGGKVITTPGLEGVVEFKK